MEQDKTNNKVLFPAVPLNEAEDIICSHEYNKMMCLNEMAQVNANERETGNGHFDSNLYRVYVIGEGGYKKFPHFHIEKCSEGWDIRMNMDGSYHSIKKKGGAGIQNDNDFQDIERIAKKWVMLPNAMNPKITNKEFAEMLWKSMNE